MMQTSSEAACGGQGPTDISNGGIPHICRLQCYDTRGPTGWIYTHRMTPRPQYKRAAMWRLPHIGRLSVLPLQNRIPIRIGIQGWIIEHTTNRHGRCTTLSVDRARECNSHPMHYPMHNNEGPHNDFLMCTHTLYDWHPASLDEKKGPKRGRPRCQLAPSE